MPAVEMEIEKLITIGEKLGLKGTELQDFVAKERAALKKQRDEERQARAEAREYEKDEAERKHRFELEKMEMEVKVAKELAEAGGDVKGFHARRDSSTGKAPKLPAFNEAKDDIDAYLIRFERYATARGWPKSQWAVDLSALLTGKGLDVYYSLSAGQADDYDELKKAILIRYELHEEGFRKRFVSAKPEVGESGSQFAFRIANYFQRWVDLAGADHSKEGIVDLLLRDRFLHAIPQDVSLFLREREPKSIDHMTELADQYLKAHAGKWGFEGNSKFNNSKYKKADKGPNSVRSVQPIHKQEFRRSGKPLSSNSTDVKPKRTCFLCGRLGHIARDCFNKEKLNALVDSMEHGSHGVANRGSVGTTKENKECADKGAFMIVTPSQNGQDNIGGSTYTLECGHQLTVLTAACRRKSDDRMPIVPGLVEQQEVKVLRDTGCSGVVVKQELVSTSQLTGESKTCILIDGTVRRFPVAEVHVDTPFFTGKVKALCMANPVYPLILGNIPGARDASNPDVNWRVEHCLIHQKEIEPINMNASDTTASVETRSMHAAKNKTLKPLTVPSATVENISVETLKLEQSKDPTLENVRIWAETGVVKQCRGNGKCWYTVDKGVIYREFVAPDVEFGNQFHQLVVPFKLREQVMKMAHESLLGGHQAAKRTSDRVLTEFWWPGIGADIKRYCQSCDICQRTIDKGRVSKVPLGEMPLMETPFERVGVDLIGPITPMTERGHRYVLVMMDYATRYPEAIPLKSITAEIVAEGLLEMFTRLGIPKQILTDQGSQFMSGVMKEMSRLLSIKQLTTTPYHAMTNGLCERQNGVLKGTLKKMCDERPRDWDRYIGPVLFAYRETPQSSTGFSPFELLYGRTVRGPMSILRELWTGHTTEDDTKSTYEYVIDLQKRLEKTCELARGEMVKSRERYRCQYNKKARLRTLKEGDEVLLLLPTDHNKLVMQWKGPFKVVKVVNRMNYKIAIRGKEQTFHINMLKKYFRRELEDVQVSQMEIFEGHQGVLDIVAVAVIEDENTEADQPYGLSNEDLIYLPPVTAKETIRDVKVCENLGSVQMEEAQNVLEENRDRLTEVPGKTNLDAHRIKVTDDEPVRSKPYPTPHALRGEEQKEIDMMLRMGIIAPSSSPYACPLTMVVKKDGTYRVCCDTRKLNAKTVFDPEPVPDQEEIFAQLSKDRYFSKIDLSKGYWQIPMDAESRKYTGFVTNQGHYEFLVMPFGLVNSAATFSRVMRKLLKGLPTVHNYIDDILIHTATWEEHVTTLKEVFRRLREANLTARPSKCFIGYGEVEFLGHIVGKGTMKPKPEKVEAIKEAPRPKTKTQLRSFLGLAGYYRKFIPNFSVIACPLTDRTKKREPNKVTWETNQEVAFQTLKNKLSSSPILHLPDLEKEFILRTDASENGMGAVLLQEHSGEVFPVAFVSKKFTDAQKAYSVMEKECLAVVYAVQKFAPYLYGKAFTIQTDHQPLSCLKRSKVANSRIMRWALALQPYRYRIQVIKGSENVGADYMSRIEGA